MITTINAKTISDAWFQCLYNLFDNHYHQDIQQGSFEGTHRLQYPSITGYIEYPVIDMIPTMPEGSNIPTPSTQEYVDNYFANYLMNPELGENETYKYSSRIQNPMPRGGTQLDRVISLLKNTPNTNQAVIEIASPVDLDVCWGKDNKCDPPCLRLIDFKVLPDNVLSVHVYFRSWDLWAGFPVNLAGLELLKQYVAQESNLLSGPMFFYSSGLHIYGYQEEVAKLRTNKK